MTVIDGARKLPPVDALARTADGLAPDPVVRTEARRVIDRARALLGAGHTTTMAALARELAAELVARQPLGRVINATGVMLHTNLGRAPLSPLAAAVDGLGAVAIEMDLEDGARSRRLGALEADLCELTGAQAALVVNNNAAALLLVLSALSAAGEVVVSRGQLVEIGGSFRVPEIVSQGGAVLREVGTTNRTHLADFRGAISDRTRVLLEVHPSNFAQVGFTATVPTEQLAALAREHDLVMVHDIGSGLVDASAPWLTGGTPAWLTDEPAARQVLDRGAHLVTFSGDKLLGGPQAGIICGDAELLGRIRRHPLCRALRFDKVRAAHLHSVVRSHLDRTASDAVPFWRMATVDRGVLEGRALAMAAAISSAADHLGSAPGQGEEIEAVALVVIDSAGAGSAAARGIDGWGVAIGGACSPDRLAIELRRAQVPIVALVRDDRVVLSMRTIDPADDDLVVSAVHHAALVALAEGAGRARPGHQAPSS